MRLIFVLIFMKLMSAQGNSTGSETKGPGVYSNIKSISGPWENAIQIKRHVEPGYIILVDECTTSLKCFHLCPFHFPGHYCDYSYQSECHCWADPVDLERYSTSYSEIFDFGPDVFYDSSIFE
ncbi:unnamed protein product [Bursaphelenchus xylophilus]|uniref:(pine wood nematode) hypothetical protein n=1 Tax=Bursaphelenchus xylophilus TaxID=6326 RepID=A0A1I7SEI6_BURXY|nr:unnamed protein product [Bursaphelenchus xylophilus]CAG9113529.1 unnamed protein product [Bursaphelenchus xylophilus]